MQKKFPSICSFQDLIVVVAENDKILFGDIYAFLVC